MCELYDWLIKKVEALGATGLRIEHGGRRGCPSRHRRHPFLVGIVDGKPFSCPLKSRPKDRSADYRWAYLRAVRARMPRPQRDCGPPSNPRNLSAPTPMTRADRRSSGLPPLYSGARPQPAESRIVVRTPDMTDTPCKLPPKFVPLTTGAGHRGETV